jgi:hypothetical protein
MSTKTVHVCEGCGCTYDVHISHRRQRFHSRDCAVAYRRVPAVDRFDEIRASSESISVLARRYGVDRKTLRAAKAGWTWKGGPP